MPGPENHSKKPKRVTLDLTANADEAALAADDARAGEPAGDGPVSDSQREPAATEPSPGVAPVPAPARTGGGLFGKLGAGIVGGVIALAGGAGLQATGNLPSFGNAANVTVLAAQVAELAAKPATPAIDPASIAALQEAQAALKQQVDALAASPAAGSAPDLTALQDKIAALETAVSSGAGGIAADPAQSQAFRDLAAKVAALEAGPTGSAGGSAVALAIAASGLKAAIDRGGPFTTEIETYASVAPASADLEALRALAAKGVPGRQELVNGFNDAANQMLAASRTPDPEASFWSRLTDSASNLVKARPVGDIAGDGPEAFVARMEINLARGDLDAVLAEAAKLPEASKAAGASYLDAVKARRDTDSLVGKALALALSAAGGKS